MSGRGTIKAGTFGGRRYREKVVATETENKQREKDLKKSRKSDKKKVIPGFKPQFIRAPGELAVAGLNPEGATDPNYSNALPKRFQSARSTTNRAVKPGVIQSASAVNLQYPLGRGNQGDGMGQRARDIQSVVNTMPLQEDKSFNLLIRQQQQARELAIRGVDEEEYDEAGFQDGGADLDQGTGGEQVFAEAGAIDDEGNVEYGAEGLELFDADVPDWMTDALPEEGDLVIQDAEDDFELEELPSRDAVRDAPPEPRAQVSLAEMVRQKKAEREARASQFTGGDQLVSSSGMFPKGANRSTKLLDNVYPLDRYQRTKPTKKNPTGDIKFSAKLLDKGGPNERKAMIPTDQYKALADGRIYDTRPGMPAVDVETGKRSREKEADMRIQGYDSQKKVSGDQFQMEEKDPKTRKLTGKIVTRQLTIAKRSKPISEMWGLDKKGMSRDGNEAYRDPYEGRRAVAKQPGKDASKKREAETKHALYIKSQRDLDPNYVPRGYDGFKYGAGASDWDKKANKDARLSNAGNYKAQNENGVQLTSDDFGVSSKLGDGMSDDDYILMKRRQAQLPQHNANRLIPAFPGASSIVAPAASIDWMGISNPPMRSLISQSDQKFIERARGAGVKKSRFKKSNQFTNMTTISPEDIAKMTDDQLTTAFMGGTGSTGPAVNTPEGVSDGYEMYRPGMGDELSKTGLARFGAQRLGGEGSAQMRAQINRMSPQHIYDGTPGQ